MLLSALIAIVSSAASTAASRKASRRALSRAKLDEQWTRLELQLAQQSNLDLQGYTEYLSKCLDSERALNTYH